jgi:3-(3-hydroxy-phenyl)propionate hydroxylase
VIDLYDVAVIGFGPTGAVAAALLGQSGLKVLVVEQSLNVYDKPRAISVDHEIMRVFQGLGGGLVDRISAHTEPFSPSEHFGAEGQLIRRLDMLSPPYPLGWTPSMVFLQPPVEALLREHVTNLPSVDVQLGCTLGGFTKTATNCDLQYTDGDGNLQQASARYVVGCDGASSSVRRIANLSLDDLGFDEPWLVIDVLANEAGLAKLPKASAQFCEPKRPASYLIGTGSHRRWEIMLLPGEDPKDMETDEQVWRLLARWLSPDEGRLWRRASYRFHALVAPQWRQGNVFIAGDAAHQQPPFLGQGMCQGIRDAANLAWKLKAVIAGQAHDGLLDTFGQERSAHVRQLTSTIKMIGASICERNPVTAQQRDQKLLEACAGVVKTVPRQDLIPGLSCGFFSSVAHPAIGTLFVQPRVHVNGSTRLLDDCLSDCALGVDWQVILSESAADWTLDSVAMGGKVLRFRKVASKNLAHDVFQETDSVLSDWFVKNQCAAVIVRPDRYVYSVASSATELIAQCDELQNKIRGNHNEANS